MRSFISQMQERFKKLRERAGKRILILALLLLLLVFMVIGGVSYLFLFEESVTQHPAMLRTITGTTNIMAVDTEFWVEAIDQTSLSAGDRLQVLEGGVAAIQYHGGSMSLVTGPAELSFEGFEESKRGRLTPTNTISLNIVSGKITTDTDVAGSSSATTYYELSTPNSAAVFEEDMFEVDIDQDGTATWTVIQGTFNVSILTPDQNGQPVSILAPLDGGESISTPQLPQEWVGNEYMPELTNTLLDLARTATEEGSSDISVEGMTFTSSNSATGITLFRPTQTGQLPQATLPDIVEPDSNRQVIEDGIISGTTPWLNLTYAPVIYYTSMPSIPFPDGWVSIPTPPDPPSSPPRYTSSFYDFDAAKGIALSPAGDRIFVAQGQYEGYIRMVDSGGTVIQNLESDLAGIPFYPAVNRLGNIYVPDRTNHSIDIFDENGSYLGIFAPDEFSETGWSPNSTFFDEMGNLYVTEVTEELHRLLVFNSEGDLILTTGKQGAAAGDFAFPINVAVDRQGRIFVSDGTNNRVQIFVTNSNLDITYPYEYADTQIAVASIIPARDVGLPRGIAIGPRNCLYVIDTSGHAIHVYDISENVEPLFSFGEWGIGDGQFNWPEDIDISSTGTIYITDTKSNRIQVWEY
ncbi:MAG: hypothetical protein SVY53_10505 [Chloroflexota bacterium]|nr:hypothetical protein [Chloroflexota bacterium]